jgi:hypothetical protein
MSQENPTPVTNRELCFLAGDGGAVRITEIVGHPDHVLVSHQGHGFPLHKRLFRQIANAVESGTRLVDLGDEVEISTFEEPK